MCFCLELVFSHLPNNISLNSKTLASFVFETPEASGQNFREEEVAEEKGCNSEASRKRRRGANFDDSSLNDQVKL